MDEDKDIVHISKFGKICDTLGPWEFGVKDDTITGILDNVSFQIVTEIVDLLDIYPQVVLSSCFQAKIN